MKNNTTKTKPYYVIRATLDTDLRIFGFNGYYFVPLEKDFKEKRFYEKTEAKQILKGFYKIGVNYYIVKFYDVELVKETINKQISQQVYDYCAKNYGEQKPVDEKPSNNTLPKQSSFLDRLPDNIAIALLLTIVLLVVGYLGYLALTYNYLVRQNQSLCEIAYKNKIEVSEVPSCFAYYEKRGF